MLKKPRTSFCAESVCLDALHGWPNSNDELLLVKVGLSELPFELLDMVLLKACLRLLVTPNQIQTDVFTAISSINYYCYRRTTMLRFKRQIRRCLTEYYSKLNRRLTVLRSNSKYLVENIRPTHDLIFRLHATACLTNERLRLVVKQRRLENKNAELLKTARMLDLDQYAKFVDCLRQTRQPLVARILRLGGVTVQVKVKHLKEEQSKQVISFFNGLQERNARAQELEVLARDLVEIDLEFLHTSLCQDGSVKIWFWCWSRGSFEMLHQRSDRLLLRVEDVTKCALGVSDLDSSVEMDKTQFRREFAVLPTNIQLAARLEIKTWVNAVTKLRNEIYVLCYDPNIIQVYAAEAPATYVRELKLNGIAEPWDMAASDRDSCLYVTDEGESCVWKIVPGGDAQVTKWLPGAGDPFTLSVTAEGNVLLVKDGQPCCLDIHRADASLLRRVQLPGDIIGPQHAVETSRGSFFVSHERNSGWTWGVSEINGNGNVVSRFIPDDEWQELNYPRHLALDPDDQVFVAEYFNNRVVLLSRRLAWKEVLLTETRDGIRKPWRMCYDPFKRQLLVGQIGKILHIYDIK